MSDLDQTSLPGWPQYSDEEIAEVKNVLESGKVNYWTGTRCRQFETQFAEYIGARYAISLSNGTMALELALYALGIGDGDEVIVPSRTFIATASSVVRVGAIPVVADIDPDSQNITADTIKAKVTNRTKAIIPVHLAGWPCDMPEIMKFAESENLKVIEDCAQATGAEINGRKVGSYGDAAAFSFCQDKILSTGGEGGMLVTNSEDLWSKAWSYKDHGKDYALSHEKSDNLEFRWIHTSFGTNMRMTEMQAAIGLIQLNKLPGWIGERKRHATTVYKGLSDLKCCRIPMPGREISHAYYRFYIFLKKDALLPDWNRNRILHEMNQKGVPCFHGSCSEIYKELAFQKYGNNIELPNARKLGETSIAFLVHPTLSSDDVEGYISTARKVLMEASG